jgi:hypothetical protein
MSTDLLFNPMFLSALFAIAATMKFVKRQSEHAFTRLVGGLWFLHVYILPDTDVNTVRVVSRWIIVLIIGTEVLSFLIRKIHDAKIGSKTSNVFLFSLFFLLSTFLYAVFGVKTP